MEIEPNELWSAILKRSNKPCRRRACLGGGCAESFNLFKQFKRCRLRSVSRFAASNSAMETLIDAQKFGSRGWLLLGPDNNEGSKVEWGDLR